MMPQARPVENALLRIAAVALGLVSLALGVAGFVIPGLPGVPFLLVAAWAFSMSNERLYRWMMTNRWFGTILSDYRAGLGIPRRIKVVAVTTVVVVVTSSVVLALEGLSRLGVATLGSIGIIYILTRPTREAALDG